MASGRSPSPPPRSRYRLLASLLVGGLALAIAVALARACLDRRDGTVDQPPVARQSAPASSPAGPPADAIPPGLARAYVALGSAADAGTTEPVLAGDAVAWAGAARRLLAAQPWRRGPGRAIVSGGMRIQLAPPAWLPAPGSGPEAAANAPAAAAARRPTPIRGAGLVKELVVPGDCIAIRFDPATAGDRDLVLLDRTGSYAVRVETGDAAEVRLDGGLVVPGRCYRIAGRVRITALAGPVGLQVVPSDAAAVLWDAPATPLRGDG